MKGCDYMNLNGGYAMIKYNSTQEELQIAYRSKRPALFYDENQRAHWAVVEETATQSVDEETQEPITLYEYSYKLLNDIEALVDNNGNHRFIVGNGNPGNVTGLTISSAKWTLNGNNLVFEILGVFSGNLSGFDKLSTFTLPEWIINKIVTPARNIVDIISCSMISIEDASDTNIKVQVIKDGNNIYFTNVTNITISDISLFKIRYNIIIDNE